MLSLSQIFKLALYGLVLWFIAALMIQFGRPLGFFEGIKGVAAYLVAIPISIWFVPVAVRVAGLEPNQVLPGITVSVVAAVLADGVGLNWGSALYGGPGASLASGAGWLLWGVGISLAYGFWQSQRVAA